MTPCVRARHMKSLLSGVERLDPALRAEVLAASRAELLECVRAATAVAWLPLALNIELADTIARCLGTKRARPFFRAMLLAEFQSSLFKPFIAGVSRAFGVTPAVFVRMVPRGWELVYRECGKLEPTEVGPGQASLVFSQLPAVCVKNMLWLDAVRSTFYTAFDLSEVDGKIEWDELDLSARRAVMRFQWDA
jgi:hypothetical protein